MSRSGASGSEVNREASNRVDRNHSASSGLDESEVRLDPLTKT